MHCKMSGLSFYSKTMLKHSAGSRDVTVSEQALSDQARSLLRNRHGLSPHEVVVLEDGAPPRAAHKAKRVVDNR